MPILPPQVDESVGRLARVRDLVAHLDREHAASGRRTHASTLMARAFRAERDLDDRERGQIAGRFTALLRHHRRIDFALGPHGAADPRARALAADVLDGRLAPDDARRAHPLDWARVLDWTSRLPADPVARFAVERSLPEWAAARWIGEPELADALLAPPPVIVRANALCASREDVARALHDRRPVPEGRTRWGLRLERPGDVWSHRAFREGYFELQDSGSQLVCELVAPPPGGLVLDACAGAGGKALALAAALGGRGKVIATDVEAHKLEELSRRARRAGASNVEAYPRPSPREWPDAVRARAGRFDRVLIDAPCSGSGTWRRNPEAKIHATEAELARLVVEQRALIEEAYALVAPGGRLIYATCSLWPEENTPPALGAPVRIAEIHGRAWSDGLTDATGSALALRPDRHDTDGFYAAVVRRPR